jgi:hypothetical protein
MTVKSVEVETSIAGEWNHHMLPSIGRGKMVMGLTVGIMALY